MNHNSVMRFQTECSGPGRTNSLPVWLGLIGDLKVTGEFYHPVLSAQVKIRRVELILLGGVFSEPPGVTKHSNRTQVAKGICLSLPDPNTLRPHGDMD